MRFLSHSRKLPIHIADLKPMFPPPGVRVIDAKLIHTPEQLAEIRGLFDRSNPDGIIRWGNDSETTNRSIAVINKNRSISVIATINRKE